MDQQADRKHPDCESCPCGSGEDHCKHAHQPWFGLTDDETAILEFERQWWKYAGAKEQAVRERFAISSTRYYQQLNAIIDKPEALAYDAMLVRRLRRLRASRARQRSARRLGFAEV
jgi:hypothetical protein